MSCGGVGVFFFVWTQLWSFDFLQLARRLLRGFLRRGEGLVEPAFHLFFELLARCFHGALRGKKLLLLGLLQGLQLLSETRYFLAQLFILIPADLVGRLFEVIDHLLRLLEHVFESLRRFVESTLFDHLVQRRGLRHHLRIFECFVIEVLVGHFALQLKQACRELLQLHLHASNLLKQGVSFGRVSRVFVLLQQIFQIGLRSLHVLHELLHLEHPLTLDEILQIKDVLLQTNHKQALHVDEPPPQAQRHRAGIHRSSKPVHSAALIGLSAGQFDAHVGESPPHAVVVDQGVVGDRCQRLVKRRDHGSRPRRGLCVAHQHLALAQPFFFDGKGCVEFVTEHLDHVPEQGVESRDDLLVVLCG